MSDTNAVNPRTARKLATGKGNIATRQWVNTQGTEVEDEADATGMKYTLLSDPSHPFQYQFDLSKKPEAGDPLVMFAVFGALTLAGNIVNSSKDDEDPIANIRARFDGIEQGVWVDRTGGGFGPRYDLDILAQAIAEVKGVPNEVATFRAKMDSTILIDGKSVRYPAAAMRNQEVCKLYEQRKPRKEVKAPDLASL